MERNTNVAEEQLLRIFGALLRAGMAARTFFVSEAPWINSQYVFLRLLQLDQSERKRTP
jgi:hypothetical protein